MSLSLPRSRSNLLKALGPGILMAGAAVGGSHVVSSTQAGAFFGWPVLIVLVLVNLFKYPFFLYGERYTAATGETILHGYRRLGPAYLGAFFVLNLTNAVLNCAGVAFITGALALNFGLEGRVEDRTLATVVAVVCALLIIFGRYRLLDKTTKTVIFLLSISTCTAVIAALFRGAEVDPGFVAPSVWEIAYVGILIQFMGWMPAPIDVGAWPSLWMPSRQQETGHRATMKEAMIDFHIGYVGTVVLAVLFVALGTLVMHGTPNGFFEMPGTVFARTFIEMYGEVIGRWAIPIVAVAAFTTMFSTTLTCIDAWPRSLAMCTVLALKVEEKFRFFHIAWITFTVLTGILIIHIFFGTLPRLLFLAMVVSFSTSPIFAWINYKTISAEWVPAEYRPGPFLKGLSWAGLIFLTASTLAFFGWLIWR